MTTHFQRFTSAPFLRAQFRTLVRAGQTFFFIHLFWEHFYCVGAATGASMLPTINVAGDWIVISKLYSRGRGIGVGDMVSYVRPVDGPGMHVSKRIIGMPGDWVVVDPEKGDEMVKVPRGHCWTTGDNLPFSNDSRHYGPVPLALIRGKVIARFKPMPKFFENGLKDTED
ncbi:unnamed protein product [Tuber melanosporum]|uniref:(Perigord truffle) hypothetical protein n=1 Tax=Tuber melanosporum (strain Mel28) TaxID=656061 RepID=D5GGY9_TUBMM|nr:uncharacterized protein GSTUM_00007623001 [Tuber melanosporum]CAZ83782.1 unnamed protein product [Tuber melanosporum]